MKQREINMILSKNAATSVDGESLINLRILDVDLPEIQGNLLIVSCICSFTCVIEFSPTLYIACSS
jgi:hypothetical protein